MGAAASHETTRPACVGDRLFRGSPEVKLLTARTVAYRRKWRHRGKRPELERDHVVIWERR